MYVNVLLQKHLCGSAQGKVAHTETTQMNQIKSVFHDLKVQTFKIKTYPEKVQGHTKNIKACTKRQSTLIVWSMMVFWGIHNNMKKIIT